MIKASAFLVAIASSLYALTAFAAAQCEGPTLDGNTWNLTCSADAGDSGDDYQCDYILVLSYCGRRSRTRGGHRIGCAGSERRHHLVGRRQGRRIGYRVGEYRQRFLRTVMREIISDEAQHTCRRYFRVHCRCFVGGVFEEGGAPTTRRSGPRRDRQKRDHRTATPASNPERNAISATSTSTPAGRSTRSPTAARPHRATRMRGHKARRSPTAASAARYRSRRRSTSIWSPITPSSWACSIRCRTRTAR